MEDMMTFTGIIIIVFGVLQIILFFKLWIMTNDIRKIKNKYLGDEVVEIQPQYQEQTNLNNKSIRVVSILFVLTSLIGIYFMPMWVAIIIVLLDIALLAYVFTRK